MSASAERKLLDLGLTLPTAPRPLGAYVEAVQTGQLLFLSGALPVHEGVVHYVGRIGNELTVDEGREATRLAVLNALALAREHLGSLDRVIRVVTLRVWLSTGTEFRDHPRVADAGSELLADIFGMERISTRMVAGVSSLPVGASAVVELVLAINT
jgi:enamine deaminase RidA (YjgF/YER057c/UK114 family)